MAACLPCLMAAQRQTLDEHSRPPVELPLLSEKARQKLLLQHAECRH
jgi:hypothetical protein